MPQLPTANEQLFLEFVNRARANPSQELDLLIADRASQTGVSADVTTALRFFDVDMTVLYRQLAAFDPVAPVAWNTSLAVSADRHTQLMIAFDLQQHIFPNGRASWERIEAAGYDTRTVSFENLFAYGTSPEHTHASFIIDWGPGPTGLQSPAGHRNAVLSDRVSEIGISFVPEGDPNTGVGPTVTTQHLANRSDYQPQLLGVAIIDSDGDQFYDIGEGQGGIVLTATGSNGSYSTTSWGSGGYQMALPNGTYSISLTTRTGANMELGDVTIAGANVKLDAFIDPNAQPGEVVSGTPEQDILAGGTGNDSISGLSGDDTIFAYGGFDTIFGDGGDDSILAGNGNDEVFAGYGFDAVNGGAGHDAVLGLNGFDLLLGGGGNDTLLGGFGNDTIHGQEGNDTLNGGLGFDSVTGGEGADSLRGLDGRDTLEGGLGDDTILGNSGFDFITGDAGADWLAGGLANDSLFGGQGNDTLTGNNGSDFLAGNAGNDLLEGNFGSDTLIGGPGDDTLRGGLGTDTFVFRVGGGSDVIIDFQNNFDSVHIDAALLSQVNPTVEDLRGYATLDVNGDIVLTFGNGDRLSLIDVPNMTGLLDDVILV